MVAGRTWLRYAEIAQRSTLGRGSDVDIPRAFTDGRGVFQTGRRKELKERAPRPKELHTIPPVQRTGTTESHDPTTFPLSGNSVLVASLGLTGVDSGTFASLLIRFSLNLGRRAATSSFLFFFTRFCAPEAPPMQPQSVLIIWRFAHQICGVSSIRWSSKQASRGP